MRTPSTAFVLTSLTALLAGCAASADSASSSESMQNAAAVPQAPLVMCVDPANPANRAIITVTNDLDLSWDMFGQRGTSSLVGAGFSFGSIEEPTMLNIVLLNGRKMVVRGNYEEERLVSLEAPEGKLDCGPDSRMKAFNIRAILDATNASFEKRAELARCDFGGGDTQILVRPALRGAGAIVEGVAPGAGRWFLSATSDAVDGDATTLIGKGATAGVPADGVQPAALPFTQLTFNGSLASDATGDRAFPANTCRVIGLNYARGLIAGEQL